MDQLLQKIIVNVQLNVRDPCIMFTVETTSLQLPLLPVEQYCSEIFGLTMQSWQKEVTEIVTMQQNGTILLVWSTCNGKLFIKDQVVVVALQIVALTVVSVLMLDSD